MPWITQVLKYYDRFLKIYVLHICKCTLRSSIRVWQADTFHSTEEKWLTLGTNNMQQNRFTKFVAFALQGLKYPIERHAHLMQTK